MDLNAYFKEMSRIIKAGGILITSTDYFETPIDTKNKEAYGAPVHIFTKEEIIQALEMAAHWGYSLISPIELDSSEKVVHWKEYDLHFTCIIFSLQKRA